LSGDTEERESLKPVEGANPSLRRKIGLKGEFALALLPTLTVLAVLGLVEVFSRQRMLFASLASSAFLIYLDPQHGTNTVRTLVIAHLLAAGIGLATFLTLGPGYLAGGAAMVASITLMIVFDAVHPPAVSTSLSFAFRASQESNLLIFALALGVTVVLVLLQRTALHLLARFAPRS
jgi:CBS-domain-containing membrane protein